MSKEVNNKLASKKNNSYYVLISDNSAILMLYRNGSLVKREFIPSHSEEQIIAALKFFTEDKSLPISVILDTTDQTYNLQTLPGVGTLGINDFVNKRLQREFTEDMIKGSMYVSRSKNERKDWIFLFIGVNYIPPLSSWVDALIELPNRFSDILLLPVESTNIIKRYNKTTYGRNRKDIPRIQMLFLHSKISGIRINVFKDEKLIFTRLITESINVDDEEITAGLFEQELNNTLQFIQRNFNKDNNLVSSIIVTSQAIKNLLQNLDSSEVFFVKEFADRIGVYDKNIANDKFTDALFSSAVINDKKILPLKTPKTKALNNFYVLTRFFKFVSVVALFFSIINLAYFINQYLPYDTQINQNRTQLNTILGALEQKKKESRIDERDSIVIAEVTKLYSQLTNTMVDPISSYEKFSKVSRDFAIIKTFEWRLDDRKANYNLSTNNQNKVTTLVSSESVNTAQYTIMITVNFTNVGSSYQELFSNFDKYIKALEQEFKNYTVEYTRINQQISLEQAAQSIPVNITIKGPK